MMRVLSWGIGEEEEEEENEEGVEFAEEKYVGCPLIHVGNGYGEKGGHLSFGFHPSS